MTRVMRCNNSNSKFKNMLDSEIINGNATHIFVFQSNNNDMCFWPIESTLKELLEDGWVIVTKDKYK